ncbi:hypothetical protein GCM10020331_049910 [Ectobacillus funiculus]
MTPLNTGLINLLLNIPILIAGYIGLGKRFICYTVLSVLVISAGLYFIPVQAIATESLLSSLFGGVLTGAGVGLVLNCAGSTGGFDIVGMLFSRKKEIQLGGFF